jgi:hypothetical protein
MAARVFEDSSGERWEVFQVQRASNRPGAVSAGLEHGWLAFTSGTRKRRLAPFPADWENAPSTELERLCAMARSANPKLAQRERRGAPRSNVVTPKSQTAPPRVDDARSPVEESVRTFALRARAMGVPAVEAMVRLKALLLVMHPAPDSEARDRRRVRRWFVEAYYFDRPA